MINVIYQFHAKLHSILTNVKPTFLCKALKKKTPDKTFYLAYDLNKRSNPHYHHPEYYAFNFSSKEYKLVSAQVNNISLKVTEFKI